MAANHALYVQRARRNAPTKTPNKRSRSSRLRDDIETQSYVEEETMYPHSEDAPINNAINEEASANGISRTSRAGSPFGEDAQHGQYFGPTSTFSFLRRAFHRFGRRTSQASRDPAPGAETSIFEYGDKRPSRAPLGDVDCSDQMMMMQLIGRYFDLAAPTHRFLHRPTVEHWAHSYLYDDAGHREPTTVVRKAIVYLVLATALLYDRGNVAATPNALVTTEETPELGEIHFQAAQRILTSETGAPKLESVQARIATVLYLLHTSRLNQAWYTFGIMHQLLIAQGLHLARSSAVASMDHVVQESEKRSYWVAYTVDTYLSVMLGRPPLMSEQGVDQKFPELVNDENLDVAGISNERVVRDCVEAAPVFHAKLARILRVAVVEQSAVQGTSIQYQIDVAQRLNDEISAWEQKLPPHLNGGIHPSSLVPIFQRQLRVLQMGACHATMIINRPLMIMKGAPIETTEPFIQRCMNAARRVVDIVMDLIEEHHKLSAFWYFQHITFHALAVVYVWIISNRKHHTGDFQMPREDHRLFELATKIQPHLAEATRLNAPSLRYSIILDELQEESKRVIGGNAKEAVPQSDSQTNTAPAVDALPPDGMLDWDSNIEFPIDMEFWNQLDNLAFEGSADLFPVDIFDNP